MQDRLDALTVQITQAKAEAKRHKRDMKSWWAWFSSLSSQERALRAVQLERETHRRAGAIQEIEQRISALEGAKLAAITEQAHLSARFGAQEAHTDIRLERAEQALEDAREALRLSIIGG